jgi:hypothetical protein
VILIHLASLTLSSVLRPRHVEECLRSGPDGCGR